MNSYNSILSFENDYYKELYYDGEKQRDSFALNDYHS